MEANYYNRNNKNLIEKHDIHQKIYKVEKINKIKEVIYLNLKLLPYDYYSEDNKLFSRL